jgi:AcrR family transcriptional regulator
MAHRRRAVQYDGQSMDDPAAAHEGARLVEQTIGGPRQRLTRDARRAQIVRVATDTFAARGYEGATIAQIAAAADCSEPTLYKHFVDKRDLLLACLRETEERVEAQIQEVISGPDVLVQWTRYADESGDYRKMLMLRMLCSTFPDDDEILGLLRGATDRMRERFRIAVELGQQAGTIRAGVDPEYVTWMWLGMSLAAFQELAVSGEDGFLAASATRSQLLLDALVPASGRPAKA